MPIMVAISIGQVERVVEPGQVLTLRQLNQVLFDSLSLSPIPLGYDIRDTRKIITVMLERGTMVKEEKVRGVRTYRRVVRLP